MNEQKKFIEEASIRLALIQPAYNGTYLDASKRAYYCRVAEKPIQMADGRQTHYSPGTLACWESNYRRGSFDALIPKFRCDSGKSRKLDEDAITAIYRIREGLPRINAKEIYLKLIADGIINRKDISLSTVQRYVKNHNLKGASNPGQKDRKAFEEEFVGGMYQGDSLYGPYIVEDGIRRRTYLIMLLDDKSRMIVGGRFFYNDNAYNFQKVLKDAISTHGIPSKTYCDNGSPYKNEQLSLICGSLGTVLIHTPIRDGASKGKVLYDVFLSVTDCLGEKETIFVKLQKLLGKIGVIPKMNIYSMLELKNKIYNSNFEILQSENLHTTPPNYYIIGKKLTNPKHI